MLHEKSTVRNLLCHYDGQQHRCIDWYSGAIGIVFGCCNSFNPIALRTAKTLWSFDCSDCNRVKHD